MKTRYSLERGDWSADLFEVEFEYWNEEPAVLELESRLNQRRDLVIEDLIRDTYGGMNGRYDRVSDPAVLLRLLLANGFGLKRHTMPTPIVLFKDHYPVRYEATSSENRINLGAFYTTATSDAIEQLPQFNAFMDNLCGMTGMQSLMTEHLLAAQYSIAALEPGGKTTLIPLRFTSGGGTARVCIEPDQK